MYVQMESLPLVEHFQDIDNKKHNIKCCSVSCRVLKNCIQIIIKSEIISIYLPWVYLPMIFRVKIYINDRWNVSQEGYSTFNEIVRAIECVYSEQFLRLFDVDKALKVAKKKTSKLFNFFTNILDAEKALKIASKIRQWKLDSTTRHVVESKNRVCPLEILLLYRDLGASLEHS